LPGLEQALDYCQAQIDMGRYLTVVTSWLSDEFLAKAIELIELLSERHQQLEVVCNDWGLLHAANGRFACELVAGRLLAVQRTDPRLAMFGRVALQRTMEKDVPHVEGFTARLKHCAPSSALLAHLRQSPLDCPQTLNLLQTKHVHRFEVSNLLQGLETSPRAGWRVTLHYPDVLIAVARDCRSLSSRKCPGKPDSTCSTPVAHAYDDFPVSLYRDANAWFYANPNVPDNLSEMGIDRLVRKRKLSSRPW
jgi:hypothetical protein